MDNNENILVAMFIQSYDKMTQKLAGSNSEIDLINLVNSTLHALLDAKDALESIDRHYIYNTLTIAMSLEKKYQGSRIMDIIDLQNYLNELGNLSITKERFAKRN